MQRNGDIINAKGGKFMNDQRNQEYLFLREEVQSNLKAQQTWSTFSVGTVLTFLGIAVNIKDQPLLCLLPLILLLLASFKIKNYRESTTKIVAYMIVRCESPDGFFWESSLNELRKATIGEVTYDCKVNEGKSDDSKKPIRNERKAGKKKKKYLVRGIATKLTSFLETQELSFMSLVCLISYNYLSYIGKSTNWIEVILWDFLSVIVLMLTVNASKNYWNISPKLIDEYEESWRKSIISAKNEATKKEL